MGEINAAPGCLSMEHRRELFPEATDEEVFCRQALVFTRRQSPVPPWEVPAALVRLEEKFAVLFGAPPRRGADGPE